MANVNREEIRKKIAARKAEKQAQSKAKFAKMRRTAETDPGLVEKDLTQLADACAAQAEAFENLRENLDLVQAPKEAALKIRVIAARNYAKAFMRIAEEAPEQLAEAVAEAYHSLDEQAGALEQLADHLGIELNATPAEEAFSNEGIDELGEAEEAGIPVSSEVKDEAEDGDTQSEEKEAGAASDAISRLPQRGNPKTPEQLGLSPKSDVSLYQGKSSSGARVKGKSSSTGNDAWTTDRDEKGEPKSTEQVEVPRVAGAGSDAFVSDRAKDAKPSSVKVLDIPQVASKSSSKVTLAGKSARERL